MKFLIGGLLLLGAWLLWRLAALAALAPVRAGALYRELSAA